MRSTRLSLHSLRSLALVGAIAAAACLPQPAHAERVTATPVAAPPSTPIASIDTTSRIGVHVAAPFDATHTLVDTAAGAIACARDSAQHQVASWRAAPPASRMLRAVSRLDARQVATSPANPRRSPFPPLSHLLLMGMTALAADRDTPRKDGRLFSFPIAAAKKIFKGALVVMTGGYAEPGVAATGLVAVGRATDTVDNSAGGAGDLNVPVERGVFRFANSAAGDAIALADIGKECYIVDDATVAKTSNGGLRSIAGRIRDVDAAGVWVDVGTLSSGEITPEMMSSYASIAALVAAGLGNSAAYTKAADGAQVALLASTAADRVVVLVVHVDEAFADGTGAQTTFEIGQTGTLNKFAATGAFTGALAGAVKVFSGTLTAGDDLLVTATKATGTGTGGVTVAVFALPAAA